MQNARVIKILVADGHNVVANAIARILDGIEEFQIVGQGKSGDEMFRLIRLHNPDIVLIDIDLPGPISGLEVVRRLHRKAPATRIMVLTSLLDGAIVHEALREGVISYLLKYSSTDELVQAIRSAYRGIPTLSPQVTQLLIQDVSGSHTYQLTSREHEVLELLAQGLNNRQIAEQLTISLSTVQFHVSNILNKLGVHNRIEAATFAVRHKLAS